MSFSTAARDVVGEGNYAYVATYTYGGNNGGLAVVNVSSPYSLTSVGSYFPSSSTHQLFTARIAKSNDNIYVDGGNVRIFAKINVSDPSYPSFIYQVNGKDNSLDLFADGGVLYYLSNNAQALFLYDVSDNNSPISGTTYRPSSGTLRKGTADDGYVYLSVRSSDEKDEELKIMRIDPSLSYLTEVSSLFLGGPALDNVVKNGNFVYIQRKSAEGEYELAIIDVSNPSNPYVKGSTPVERIGKMVFSQNCIFIAIAGKIDLYDVGVPFSPSYINTFIDSAITSIGGFSVAGDILLIADGGGGNGKLRTYRMIK